MRHAAITDKTIWITGASSGIGLDVARGLACARNFLYVSARSEEKLQALKREYPDNVHVIPLDVTNAEQLAEAERQINQCTDHLDILISCAGVCEYDDGPQLPNDLYERVMQTNFHGAVSTVKIALPLLRRSTSYPQIVAVSSLAAMVPFPRAAAYGASKVALEYFLQSLKVDISKDNIDITIVRPGFVDTPLTRRNDFDMPFIMSSDEAAQKVIGAIGKRKLFASFPNQMAIPLGIFSLLPRLWISAIAPKFKKPGVL